MTFVVVGASTRGPPEDRLLTPGDRPPGKGTRPNLDGLGKLIVS